MIKESNYQSPDIVDVNGRRYVWRDLNALPIFVLNNGQIIYCKNQTKHLDYINAITDPVKRRRFINSIVLQGRYWMGKDIFSFWYIDEDYNWSDVIRVMEIVSNKYKGNVDGSVIAYRDYVKRLVFNEKDDCWNLIDVENTREHTALTDEDFEKIDFMFQSDKEFFQRNNEIVERIGGSFKRRELNDYELLCAGCHQMMVDFFHKESSFYNKNDFATYIRKKYNLSFYDLIGYFESNLRNKCMPKDNDIDTSKNDDEVDNVLLFLGNLGVSDTETKIVYYTNGEPYSYIIKTTDKQKAINVINAAKKEYVVDRIQEQKIKTTDNVIYSFRIRKKS